MPVPKLLSVGEAFDDLVFVGLERIPRGGEEVRTDAFLATIGGGAVITAVAASRLGLRVELVSGLSDQAARRLGSERRLTVTNVRRRGEPHAVTAALSIGGERAFVTFDGMNRRLEQRVARAISTSSASHVHLALYPRHTAAWIRRLRALQRRGLTCSWDFGWNDALARDRMLPALIDALDVVFVNEREARLYAGAPTLARALRFWRARHPTVVIKRGAKGCLAIARAGDLSIPAPRVTPIDTTGAGDAFNGGFLAAWMRGKPLAACMKAGNHVGAASTRRPGGIDALPKRRRRR